MLPLFECYPKLAQNLPWVPLGSYPTPVQRAEKLGAALGLDALYVKRDDSSGDEYGGNKVRKLEFMLAEARRRGLQEVLTFGGTGSNHALATAIYADKLGMRSISVLTPQPKSPGVQRSLLLSHRYGAELHLIQSFDEQGPTATRICDEHCARTGQRPMVIPTGGSSPLGTVGSLNGAYELKAQIDAGQAPLPDVIYVALGSMGTAAGIVLGLRALGLPTRVEAVRVVRDTLGNRAAMAALVQQTTDLLREADPSFPDTGFTEADAAAAIRDGHYGEGYAVPTSGGQEAVELARSTEGIALENTYTGKAFAALVEDARAGKLAGKTVLFWNTYNSRDLTPLLAEQDWRRLPDEFHECFE
jgi:D-cysteine desulfhydrase